MPKSIAESRQKSTRMVSAPRRPMMDLERYPDDHPERPGLFVEPKDSDFKTLLEEIHRRNGAAKHAHYADQFCGDTMTWDPTGKTICGHCNKEENGGCGWVKIKKVDLERGSCEDYENICAGDAEFVYQRLTIEEAGYAISASETGWGCVNCPFQWKSDRSPDSQGRDYWCGLWAFRIFLTACCKANGAKTVPIPEEDKIL